MNDKTKRLTLMAMYAAMAFLLTAVGRLPISSMDFLKYDPKDVILAICGFSMGSLPCLLVTVVVSLIEMVTLSSTGSIGFLMNVISSAAFACVASAVYAHGRSLRRAVIALIAGVAVMTGMMLLWNYLITPLYMGTPREAVAAMLLPVFLPFNLIKGGINAALTMLIYKPVTRALRSAHLLPERENVPRANAAVKWTAIIAAIVLAGCIIAALVIRHVI